MNDESKFSVDEILEAERKAKANGAPEETGEFSFLHGARALSFAQNSVEPAMRQSRYAGRAGKNNARGDGRIRRCDGA
ncbi:MAG: hypothetical protein V8P99_06480 [Oscillospiraceae bacterium]